ncbi:MAG: hypothetical protein CL748_02090 [Chloroflexi bacterium]|nr:hypothetical protein [Chloroflexota bacterium]
MKIIIVLFSLLSMLFSGCQASGKNPENIDIPVIKPTPNIELCLNDDVSDEIPSINEIQDSDLIVQNSGISTYEIKKSEGKNPTIQDLVKMNYVGWLPDGCVFDSSYSRGGEQEMLMINLIPGWIDALLTMSPGGIKRVKIPSSLAYGETGSPPIIPPNTDLIFHIELVNILTPDEAIATATAEAEIIRKEVENNMQDCDNSDYPANAPQFEEIGSDKFLLQDSGIKIADIKIGDGPSPFEFDEVELHYTGWLMNGCVFDSSFSREKSSEFPVDGVIQGFKEAILGMNVNGIRRVEIPPELGYGERGAGNTIPPDATLVFHIELIAIK